jgi:CheY-like chemotaxis protein/DNA-binding XRE family transcriptional regulator
MSHKDLRKRFGLVVKNWRARSGISQEELAWRADLHRTYIADIERGARNASLLSLEKLASAFEVSLSTLFTPLGETSEVPGIAVSASECPGSVDILLIEDNPREAALTIEALRTAHVKNRIEVAADRAAALEYLFDGATGGTPRRSATRRHLVLLDLNLPRGGALQLLRSIKRDDRTRRIPVVMLASARDGAKIDESRRLGADIHLVKPIDFRRFFEATLQLKWHWSLKA